MYHFERVLALSRRLGIDECELTIVEKKITTVRITDSEIAEIKQGIERDFGIRTINQKRIFTYHTNNEEKLEGAIENMHTGGKTREFWKGLPHEISTTERLEGTFDKRLADISGAKAADIAQEMINSALNDKISSISGSLNIVSEKFEICNSNGLYGSDSATYMAGMINSESESGSVPVSGLGQECCRTLDAFSAENVGADAKDMCLGSINPKICEGGRYTLILEPYSVGELLAFVASPNFGLKTYSEERSCLAGRRGEQVAAVDLNLVDDPHIQQGIGTRPFDGEGVKTKENCLIDGGTFRDVFANLYDGFKQEAESTGNASRTGVPMGRSADPIPGSAPHNLRIKAGDKSIEEMICDTRHGLLVGRLWYTYALNPIRGDFSCTARSGIRMIEDGKITGPARPVRIVHSLPALLWNITGIGDTEKNVLQWASIPSVTPAISVGNVPVAPT